MKAIQKVLIAAAAVLAMTACSAQDKPKFNEKEYAERKTERLDAIVDLTDAQEKEVYAVYLQQGQDIKKHIKAMKKEACDMKRPDGKKADCKKAECDKANCTKKAECNKADCKKDCATCDKKAECKKAECDKAKCTKKAECNKADCKKDCATCDKKAECKKADCKKDCATCDKKAECKKGECDKAKCDKKAECDKVKCDKRTPRKPHFKHNPEARKAHFEKLNTILTPEQVAKLKEHHAKRFEHAHKAQQCCPTENCQK